MKLTFLAVLSLAVADISGNVPADKFTIRGEALRKQTILETFEHPAPAYNCSPTDSCADSLPGPINGLTFENLQPAFSRYYRTGGMFAYDKYFYAALVDATKPVTISSQYSQSCVRSFRLHSIAAGCSSSQKHTDPNSGQSYTFSSGANCSITVVGRDIRGGVLGIEEFFYNPGDLQFNSFGFPYWSMVNFNTTKKGLKGKDIRSLTIQTTNIPANDPNDMYVDYFSAGIDAVSYTLTNWTRCHRD